MRILAPIETSAGDNIISPLELTQQLQLFKTELQIEPLLEYQALSYTLVFVSTLNSWLRLG